MRTSHIDTRKNQRQKPYERINSNVKRGQQLHTRSGVLINANSIGDGHQRHVQSLVQLGKIPSNSNAGEFAYSQIQNLLYTHFQSN